MSYIYTITNRINGMQYVGNTTKSIEERWKEHKHDARKKRCKNRPLYAAMNLYGFNNFEIRIIEDCDQQSALNREEYWIIKLGTYENGYNDTMGGAGKHQIDYKLVKEIYNKVKNQRDTAKMLNISTDSVKKILSKEAAPKYSKIETLQKYIKKITVYSSGGNYISRFNSAKCAAIWLCQQRIGTPQASAETNIRKACRKKTMAYGYIWKYDDDNKIFTGL